MVKKGRTMMMNDDDNDEREMTKEKQEWKDEELAPPKMCRHIMGRTMQ
jgi:hypothetical protein